MTGKSYSRYVAAALISAAALPALAEPLPPMDCVIEPNEVVDLSSAVDGVVKETLVDRGDFVEQDEVVALLDAGVELAALEYAKARAAADAQLQAEQVNAAFAVRRKERLETLFREQALSSDEMDEIATDARLKQLQLKQATEARRLAELDMRQAEEVAKRQVIRSPVRGVVVQRYLSAGESVENKAIMRIAEIDPLRAEVIVPVAYFGAIKAGQHALVVPEAPKNQPHQAVVTLVDRVADAASGTFRARLALPNPDYSLPSGLRCSVRFLEGPPANAQRDPAPPPPAPRPANARPGAPALSVGSISRPAAPTLAQATSQAAPPAATPANAPANATAAAPVEATAPAHTAAAIPELPRGPLRRGAVRPAETPAADALMAATAPPPAAESLPGAPDTPPSSAPMASAPASATSPVEFADGACLTLGPLSNLNHARAMHDALLPLAGNIVLRQKPGEGSADGYLVLSAPQASAAAAASLVEKMRAAGLSDIAVLRAGPYAGRVSAGIYNGGRMAQSRLDAIEALGFDFDLEARGNGGNGRSEYWLDVRTPGDPQGDGRFVAALRGLEPPVATESVSCADNLVASRAF